MVKFADAFGRVLDGVNEHLGDVLKLKFIFDKLELELGRLFFVELLLFIIFRSVFGSGLQLSHFSFFISAEDDGGNEVLVEVAQHEEGGLLERHESRADQVIQTVLIYGLVDVHSAGGEGLSEIGKHLLLKVGDFSSFLTSQASRELRVELRGLIFRHGDHFSNNELARRDQLSVRNHLPDQSKQPDKSLRSQFELVRELHYLEDEGLEGGLRHHVFDSLLFFAFWLFSLLFLEGLDLFLLISHQSIIRDIGNVAHELVDAQFIHELSDEAEDDVDLVYANGGVYGAGREEVLAEVANNPLEDNLLQLFIIVSHEMLVEGEVDLHTGHDAHEIDTYLGEDVNM
mmetsp:Transcript_1951/g.2843  ORF Transcript_1951/g.2843 Transcript_1951/m.2843 type:complete len:343 (+) Transcript_1951:970-1998(+)